MLFSSIVSLVGVVSTVAATHLYVSSYNGTITTLSLTERGNGAYSLQSLAVNDGCSTQPSFLLLNRGVVYCVNEGFGAVNGSISEYRPTESGVLNEVGVQTSLGGPVHQASYNQGKSLVVAHYGGSGLSTWNKLANGSLAGPLQNFFWTGPVGPRTDRQDAPHPHGVFVDPTDKYVVVPDLGSDYLRTFRINGDSLTELTPFVAPAGSGPRHGAFLVQGGKTYFFLLSELAQSVTTYVVTYGANDLSFTSVFVSSIYGPNGTVIPGVKSAEVVISPCHRYLLTSSRIDNLFQIPAWNGSATTLPSDTLQVWSIDGNTGKLGFKQIAPSGGTQPRQLSLNARGTLAAVGHQDSGNVVIVERNVVTGEYGKFLADFDIPGGQVTSVIWDESR